MLLDRAGDVRVGGAGQQGQRVPQAEGGLQRAGVGVQAADLGVRAPSLAPQGAEVAAAPPPDPGAPLTEVEVPEGMVDPGRLPVQDAGQPAVVGQQLVFVDVAVDQDRCVPGGAEQQIRPGRGAVLAAQAARGLGGRGRARGRAERPAQPAMMGRLVVAGRARADQGGRLELVPAGDGPAQLAEERFWFGRDLAAQPGDGRELERLDVRVLPAAEQARHDLEPGPGQGLADGEFPLEPLHACRRGREQEHPVGVHQDQLVPPGHVQHEPVRVRAGECGEPGRLRGDQHGAGRPAHDVAAHIPQYGGRPRDRAGHRSGGGAWAGREGDN